MIREQTAGSCALTDMAASRNRAATPKIKSRVRALVKDLVPPLALRAYRKVKSGRYYGLNKLDSKLEKYINYDGGFYVELGANDGITQSNSLYYERNRNWTGILIEPSPQEFIKCKQNRANTNAFFCAACVSFDYPDEFVRLAYSSLCSVALELETDIGDPMEHALDGAEHTGPDDGVPVFGAEAKTLNELLIRGLAPQKIDLLSLDVEGAELEVLKGIDHQKFRFAYMLIECRNIDRLSQYLAGHGYRLVDQLSFHDYLFASDSE